jgi:predicted aspartyl protease
MGTFRVRLGIGDQQGQRYTDVETLVDTGATYTTLPAGLLRDLGVQPRERAEFEMADGRIIERQIGYTWVRFDGRSGIVPVVFAEEGAEALLGAVTLEVLRLGVDPVRRQLVPVRGLLMQTRSP